jgi:hypothetical protein
LEKHITSIFRDEEAEQETSKKQTTSRFSALQNIYHILASPILYGPNRLFVRVQRLVYVTKIDVHIPFSPE